MSFGYNSELFIKAQAYAPINPLQSTSRFHKRARLHMNLAESAAAGYINVWACIKDLCINGTAVILFRKFTEEEHIIATKLAESTGKTPPQYGVLTVTLTSFPINYADLSFSFDGSVLADKIGKMINSTLHRLNDILKKDNHTFSTVI